VLALGAGQRILLARLAMKEHGEIASRPACIPTRS
jgi:hypothetical protein